MTDSSLPAGLIEAVADAVWEALDRATCTGDARLHPPNPIWGDRADPPEDFDRWIEYAAHKALTAAFSWRDDKPCETCGGTGFLEHHMMSNRNVKITTPWSVLDELPPGPPSRPSVRCPDCTSGRVEGDRRVILAREVESDERFSATEKAAWLCTDGVPVFVATPVQEETD
jgi:hypothetical protein